MTNIGTGIIGAGVRGVYCLGQSIVQLYEETNIVVQGIYDIIPRRSLEAKSYLEQLYAQKGIHIDIRVYDHYHHMIDDSACEIILITNHTYQHREPTIAALSKGKRVFLDKPISVTYEDGQAICRCEKEMNNPVMMGFTRRYEQTWKKAKELLDSGVIGPLYMMEIHSVIPYSRYLQTWHRKRTLSGGSLNDKCSHHFDVFNWMAGEYPQYVSAVGGRSAVFIEDPTAPQSCRVCDRLCHYRRDPHNITDGAFVLQQESWGKATAMNDRIDTCVYAPGADICDHALISVVYPSNIKASLFFSIFGPDSTDQELLYLIGEKGKIVLNRHEGVVTLHTEWGKKREHIDCRDDEFTTSHFGADLQLIRNLKKFYEGNIPPVGALDGLISLKAVLAAQESIVHRGKPVDLLP